MITREEFAYVLSTIHDRGIDRMNEYPGWESIIRTTLTLLDSSRVRALNNVEQTKASGINYSIAQDHYDKTSWPVLADFRVINKQLVMFGNYVSSVELAYMDFVEQLSLDVCPICGTFVDPITKEKTPECIEHDRIAAMMSKLKGNSEY